jgi:hypothetical protein
MNFLPQGQSSVPERLYTGHLRVSTSHYFGTEVTLFTEISFTDSSLQWTMDVLCELITEFLHTYKNISLLGVYANAMSNNKI